MGMLILLVLLWLEEIVMSQRLTGRAMRSASRPRRTEVLDDLVVLGPVLGLDLDPGLALGPGLALDPGLALER